MRTTITLTPEADSLVRRVMRQRGLSFKDAVNAAIIDGLAPREEPFQTPTRSMGKPRLNLDRTMQLIAELDNEEFLRKQAMGK